MPSIAALASAVVAFFAVAILVPAATALIHGEWLALEAFVLLAIAYGFLSSMMIMALAPRLRRLNRAGVFSATIAMWLALCVAALPPFMLIEHQTPARAVFEAVSAATTLGVTFRPHAEISASMAIYRGVVAWQGGLLTLLLAVYVLGRYAVGGTPNRHLRNILHSFQEGDPRIVQTFIEVFVPYSALTLLCTAALVISRVQPEDAFSLALNIVSTNGFIPLQTGATALNNIAGEIILLVFMVIGATSIIWHRALVNRRWQLARSHTEIPAYLLLMTLIAAVAASTAFVAPAALFGPGEAAFNAIFDTVSIMTTTGITHDHRVGIGLPFELILGLAFVGGCSYSTSGGIKVFRLNAMLHHTGNEIRKLIYPHIVQAHSVEEDPATRNDVRAIWSAFYLALITIVVATLVFALNGYGLDQSLSLAVGAFSATANVVSNASGAEPSDGAVLALAVTGFLARVELLVALAAVTRDSW